MKKLISSLLVFFIFTNAFAQSVGIGTSNPDSSALLELNSSNKGFLPPRITTSQRNAITLPAEGLQIFNTTTHCLEMFVYGKWQNVFCGVADTTTIVDSTLLTDIDGHTYPTTKICNQTWMAKNLDVARYRNGDIIPQVTDPTEWTNLTTGAWCWYNNDSATYGSVYGRLYNWYAVNDPRGLAPTGWHVPCDGEWNQLVKCIDSNADTSVVLGDQSSVAGGYMKEVGLSHWNAPNMGATNSSGFNGLPSGNRDPSQGNFGTIGSNAIFWSSTESTSNSAWVRYIFDYQAAISKSNRISKNDGFSVRCVKNTPITTLNDGLVAYYPFNGNANDESGNGNNGVVNGATLTTDRFGNSGKAYSFDGVNDEIRISHNPNLNLIGDFTLSSWYYPNSFPTNNNSHTIIAKRDDNLSCCSPQVPYNFSVNYIQNGSDYRKPLLAFANGSYHFSQSQAIVNLQEWQNLTLTYSMDTCKIYLNGLLTHAEYFPSSFRMSNNANLLIGSINRAYGDEYMNGKLDEIRIYNRALSQEEITYLATH